MPTSIPFSHILRKGFTLTDEYFVDIHYSPYQKAYKLILLINNYYEAQQDNKISELNNIENQIIRLKENFFKESVFYPKIEAELEYLWYSYSLITLMSNPSCGWRGSIFNHPLLLQLINFVISLKDSEHFLEKLPPLCKFAYEIAQKISRYFQIGENFNTQQKIRPVLKNMLEKELMGLKNEISTLLLKGREYIDNPDNKKYIKLLLENHIHIIKPNEIFKIIENPHWKSCIEDEVFKVLINLQPIHTISSRLNTLLTRGKYDRTYLFFLRNKSFTFKDKKEYYLYSLLQEDVAKNDLEKIINHQFIPSLDALLAYFSQLNSFKQLDSLLFLENYDELVMVMDLLSRQPIYYTMKNNIKLPIKEFCKELNKKIDRYKILCHKRINNNAVMERGLEKEIESLHQDIMTDLILALLNKIYEQHINIIANSGNHPNASDINQLDKEIEQLFSIYNDSRVQNLSEEFFGLKGNIDWKGNIIASKKILPLDEEIKKDLKRFNTDSSDNTHLSNYPDSLFSNRSA